MTFVKRDGKIYSISEVEIDLAKEQYKLQAWKDARINDAREIEEYHAKVAEIDDLKLHKDTKEVLKNNVMLHSGSGITQEMVDAQQAIIDEITAL